MAENTREIVLDMLISLEKEEQFSNKLIKAVLDKYNYLDGREKAFIKRCTEGCVERQIELDYYLNAFSSVPVRKMKPLIRSLLRMSVYQILYMDAIPDSAVVNEACKLAVKRKFTNLRGFVNGVLRNISRQKESLPMPDEKKEPLKYLSVRYSMPEWLAEMWMNVYGYTVTERILQGLLAVHPVTARFRLSLSEGERVTLLDAIKNGGASASESPYLPYAFSLTNTDAIGVLPGFAEGKWTVQDISSVLAVEAAGITENDFVIDACAAPGGKSMLAAERAGEVLSRDLSAEKTDLIRENAERFGLKNITVQEWDAVLEDGRYTGKADVLLLDVPCSGLGIIGKKRDIKYHASPEGLRGLNALQKQIVESSVPYLKQGGTLVYSTCTINTEENEEMVKFISENLGLEPVNLKGRIPELLLEQKKEVANLLEAEGIKNKCRLTEEQEAACVQLLPGFMEADGFFFAVFKKQ